MYCQKCRSSLKIDHSLEDLNPAAFNLLIGATGASLRDKPPKALSASSRYGIANERLDLYNAACQHSQSPQIRRQTPGSVSNLSQHEGPPTPTKSRQAPSLSAQSSGLSKENPQMSFMMLSESQWTPPPGSLTNPNQQSEAQDGREKGHDGADGPALSVQMEATKRLFSILSSKSDIDHPICSECTDLVISGLQTRLGTATRERDAYVSFLKQQQASIPTNGEVRAAQKALDTAKAESSAALAELKALEAESAALAAEQDELDEEAAKLDEEEAKFWETRNALTSRLAAANEHKASLSAKAAQDNTTLAALQRTNVYNDAFCIGHDGYFGTINGLRLGRLPSQPVEWSEINAAWGQTALLLLTVAEKLGFTFDGYRLRPCGSVSRIDRLEPRPSSDSASTSTTTTTITSGSSDPPAPKTYDLFASSDIPLVGRFVHGRFERGMIAFLECVRQLGAFVERGGAVAGRRSSSSSSSRATSATGGPASAAVTPTASLPLPYAIKRDRIGDASIKLGYGVHQGDEGWTRACKYTLTCCKFLLATASNLASASGSGAGGAGAGAEREER